MDLERSLGLRADGDVAQDAAVPLVQYINVKLAALGRATVGTPGDLAFIGVASDLLAQYRESGRGAGSGGGGTLCPADARIQAFLDAHLGADAPKLPTETFVIDRYGLAREMSLPFGEDHYRSDLLDSYRVAQGVLHNPKNDRRTTEGVFHVAEGGLAIPSDKRAVPLAVYAELLRAAFNPPAESLRLPFTARAGAPAELFVSLLLRPRVVPEVPGFTPRKSMEIRFFAPGALVSNLDFVESIFGNAGNPYLPENDAALDVEHWTGHTGCVVLAPHLVNCLKKDLGLPHVDRATDRQKAEGMCWSDPSEKYNLGKPFKITCRTDAGIMVTILADNYYGYSKKEVKTQISFAANLYGTAEEEHAGGALAFPSYLQGERFVSGSKVETRGQTIVDTVAALGDAVEMRPEGYAVDRHFPSIVYVPEDVAIDMPTQKVSWSGGKRSIKLLAGHVYVLPSGFKVRMEKHPGAPSWRLVGTAAEGTFLHKPCTVSGGGKSEISKSILGSIVYGPIFVADFERDLDAVEELTKRDYGDRFPPRAGEDPAHRDSRPLLSPKRSLGSVIKMLTPSPEYTPAYNAWLATIPEHVRPLVFIIKRFYRPDWGDDWRGHFTVDTLNGSPGHELKVDGRKLVGSYLRVGFSADGGWRLHKLRQDYIAADKVQTEDDISATATVPLDAVANLPEGYGIYPSVKVVENCEYRLFQRPDDAIHRGLDAQAERDMARPGLFASNYQPIAAAEACEMVEDVAAFEQWTPPMRDRIARAARDDGGFVVSSAHPRIVDGAPTKNPRYLQVRPDVAAPRDRYLAETSTRLYRRLRPDQSVVCPVSSVLAGRRNNPPDKAHGIRALAVYNPIHYQELPELFMDYICSLTGKSPSTTGAGSEGALTKGPFNALLTSADLNAALVSYVLSGYAGYTTAAGYVGPDVRVDHDISLLIPELWARLPVHQREPDFLIANGYLERVKDYDFNGRRVLASRLGHRITAKFVHDFFGKLFDNPDRVFDDAMLRPEEQDPESFADGVDNIVEAQQRVARGYFLDGSFERCCPPIATLLSIMAKGNDLEPGAYDDAALRASFARDDVLASDWYRERLKTKLARDAALWRRHVASLEAFVAQPGRRGTIDSLGLEGRLERARAELAAATRADAIDRLRGTIGAEPRP